MKENYYSFLLISFCGGSSEFTSTQLQQDQELSQEKVSDEGSQDSKFKTDAVLMNKILQK